MKNLFKFIISTIFIVLFIASIYIISWFSNFYNNLNYLGIGKILLQDIIVFSIILFLLTIIPLTLFRIRSSLSLNLFSKTIELTEKHKKFLLFFDIIGTIIVFIILLTNSKSIYFFLNITNWNNFNIIEYPFTIKFSKLMIEYLLFTLFYTLLPVFYLSHKSYLIRFIGLSIIPHRVPITLLISVIIFLIILSISVFVYSVILSLELYPTYSLILTLGIITSASILLYSVGVFINLLRNSKINWYENLAPVILIIVFVISSIFSKSLPDISLIRLEFIERIHSLQTFSQYTLRIKNSNISETITQMDISKLEDLKKLKITEYYFEKPNTKIMIIRKPKILERIYLIATSGIIDKYLKPNVYITNYIDIEKTVRNLLPTSFLFSSKVGNTNYIDISFPYEFDKEIFFYRRYLIIWTSEKDIKILTQKNTNYNSISRNILTGREYYLINNKLKLPKTTYSLFSITSPNFGEYYLISVSGESIIISNNTYISYKVNDYNEGETFALIDNVPLFLSNIIFENMKVGIKTRYFDIEGRGGNISESISNLVGNAIYYYKVVELTNKIEKLKKYLEQHKEDIPPDIFEKLKMFISN